MTTPDAVTLPHTAFEPEGAATAPPLLIAHGLYGRARNFTSVAKRLSVGRRVVTVDMRNHGEAPHDARMDYPAMAADLADAIQRLCGGRAVLLGHSMGGKAAMVLALTRPELLAGLIVGDIAPVPYAHPEHAQITAAMRALPLAGITRRSAADPLLAAGIAAAPVRAFILQNLAIDGGVARWQPNLAAIWAGLPDILGFPALSGAAFPGPTLFLHGGASAYVTPAYHEAIRTRFPAAEIEAIPGAGHWIHAEAPDAFVAAVSGWLARSDG